MAKLVALLRAINVGKGRRVAMSELRDLATKLGLRDVATYIQSGNMIFESDASAEECGSLLEPALAKTFGFEIPVVLRTGKEWTRHVAGNPFAKLDESEANRVVLHVSKKPPAKSAVAALRERAKGGEKIEVAGGALWIHYPDGQGRSKLSPGLIDEHVGSPSTARNLRTALVLRDMLG